MTIPAGVLREVFAREHPDRLLHLLAEADAPILYSQARDALGLQPEQFARALRALESWGLVQLRTVPKRERPDDRRRVRIELNQLGRIIVRFHDAVDREWKRIADEEGLTLKALAVR